MAAERTVLHVGEPVDTAAAAWGALPDETTPISLTGGSARDDGADEHSTPPTVLVRLGASDADAPGDASPSDASERLRSVRERYPDGAILAYSPEDDPDAAIDASRLGIEYVSGRRLTVDGETLADRVAERADDGPLPDAFLEEFVRIVSDRTSGLPETLDALLDLGRDRLGLSIGYTSRTTDARFSLHRHRGGSELLSSLIDRGRIDPDGSLPLEHTYCRRTVGTDGGSDQGGRVVAFTDPTEAGWDGDPAHELFGLGSYIGGRVVVDGEVFGSLCFADERRRERSFTESDRLFVELLADWLGRAFERRAAREQRERAVEQLENTLERIDDGFFALDEEWRFTYVNDRATALLDRSADELIGRNVWEEFPEALGQTYETNYRRAMAEQETVSFEDRYDPLDLQTEVTAYPSPDGLSVFFSDVTDRKRREETLERLLRVAERMQRETDSTAVAERLVDAAGEILDYGISGVRLFDDEDGVLRLVATSDGIGDRFENREPRSADEGVVGEIYESGEPAVWRDLTDRDDDREYHGMRSLVGVPLGDHGVFLVGSVEPDAFGESDVSVIELLATNATATLDAQRRQERLGTYESALKNVDDMVCVLDDEGTVTYATDPFVSWLDLDDADLIGRRLSEAFPPSSADRVDGALSSLADGSTASDAVAGWSDGSRSVELSLDRRGNERPRHGELRLSALSGDTGGFVGSLSDLTDLRRTRTKLSRERDRFDRLFERLPDPVMEVALEPNETVITGINSAFAAQFGYDESALRGRTIDALDIHDDRLVGVDTARTDGATAGTEHAGYEGSIDDRVRAEGVVTAEVHRRTVDGPREFLFRGFTYETDGGRRAFGIYTDITDRKRRERYFRVVNRILRHNLRNELNVVFGFASEIAATTDDELISDYARRIETTGKRLADVAEGAAAIRRVVEEGLVSEAEAVSVAAVAERLRARYADSDPAAQVTVDVDDDATVRGDERFAEALDHLIENAIEHARSDAPRVVIAAECDPDAEIVTVTVADDGPGIPESVRGVITGNTEVTQLTHNTGIGLWIVAWVAEAYGGDIAFGSGIDGDGTTVTLRLPAAE